MKVLMRIDADAVALLAQKPLGQQSIANAQTGMTPHDSEVRRFVPEVITTTSFRLALAQAAPDQPRAIVSAQVFKRTVKLATAGSGDWLPECLRAGLLPYGLWRNYMSAGRKLLARF
jgi:NAD(P)H-hydrate repair Nnr-like enzyme with NAD(P)H-hydrate dehydratase domain